MTHTNAATPYLTLGIDLGKTSCGFALIDVANHQILEMGSRLWDAPEIGRKKISAAVNRREHRSVRRNIKRNKDRRKHILMILADAKLIPQDADASWLAFKKGDLPQLMARARGLDEPLSDRTLAQVLYILSKHRGYMPHGEDAAKTDAETGKVLKALAENTSALQSGEFRTVGEYLYAKGSSRNTSDNYEHCVKNEQIVDEAHKLIAAQRKLGNRKLTDEFENAYIDAMTWQHIDPDYDQRVYKTVGHCTFFSDEYRAATADLSSEMCNAWEKVGSITVVEENGTEHALPADIRREIVETLFSPVPLVKNKDCKVTYSQLRKRLDLSGNARFKGIPYTDEKKDIYRPIAWRYLRNQLSSFAPELLQRMRENRAFADSVCEALTFASSEDSLKRAIHNLQLTDKEEQCILELPFNSKVFKGYGMRSLKALEMLLDAFEDENIVTLYDAMQACGLKPSDKNERLLQLPPYSKFDETCKNPVVLRAMAQMRKVINAIIRQHGIPDEIHIEIATELKQSKKQKAISERKRRENERANDTARKEIAQFCKVAEEKITRKQILKYQLYKEQSGRDVYGVEKDDVCSGAGLELQQVILEDGYAEIDHILPYSRTADDRRSNKVLVLTASNRNKGQRTPYEWMTSGEQTAPNWEAFRLRVINNNGLSPAKKEHLLNTTLGADFDGKEFLNRNLNDTRYMSKAAYAYIKRYLALPDDGKQHVFVNAGGATAILRHQWGLNIGTDGEKNREDNRHHAVDACVIAMCKQSYVQKIARASARKHSLPHNERAKLFEMTQPWMGFADAVRQARENVVPTRAANHGVTGQAFEETAYTLLRTDKQFDYLGSHKDGEGTETKARNAMIMRDGNVRMVGGMAFIRLWLDPTAREGRGTWYAEPVYYADIPNLVNGSYQPKVYTAGTRRQDWKKVPATADPSKTITLFHGDVLSVNGCIARFNRINISNNKFLYTEVLPEGDTQMPSLSKWDNNSDVHIIQEDVLGHCYRDLLRQLKD